MSKEHLHFYFFNIKQSLSFLLNTQTAVNINYGLFETRQRQIASGKAGLFDQTIVKIKASDLLVALKDERECVDLRTVVVHSITVNHGLL